MSKPDGTNDQGLFAEIDAGVQAGASDWQFRAGEPVYLRVAGKMTPLGPAPLSVERVHAIAAKALGVADPEKMSCDGAFARGDDLFRLHGYRAGGAYCFALRRLPAEIPDLNSLGVPPGFARAVMAAQRGLILVTGPTGAGKSTTLAAAVNRLNQERAGLIFTLEDPIEYRHAPKRALVRQLEYGRDFSDFGTALHGALRADPDIILVGEMRDRKTMAAALTAAETGHLVLATLHASSAAEAVTRVAGAFPPADGAEVRAQLAQQLVAVLAQQLIRTAALKAQAAFELLIATPGVRRLVLDPERRSSLIANEVATGREHGMIAMDQSLEDLWRRGAISRAEALRAAFSPPSLEPLLRRTA